MEEERNGDMGVDEEVDKVETEVLLDASNNENNETVDQEKENGYEDEENEDVVVSNDGVPKYNKVESLSMNVERKIKQEDDNKTQRVPSVEVISENDEL